MTAEQWGAIIVLLNSEPLTQRRLGGQLCLEKSSVSRLVHGLERRGWVVRSSDPTDSRQKLVTPTPKLLDTAERCAVIAGRILEEAQTGSSENEISTVKSALASSIKNLQEMAELATNPIDHDLGDQHEKT